MKEFLQNVGKDTMKGKALHRLAEGAMAYVVTADDVTAGSVEFTLDAAPLAVEVSVFSDEVTTKAWDGAVTVVGAVVTVDNSGAVDFAAGDVIVVKAYHA